MDSFDCDKLFIKSDSTFAVVLVLSVWFLDKHRLFLLCRVNASKQVLTHSK